MATSHVFLSLTLAISLFLSIGCTAEEFPYTPPKNFTLNYQYITLHHPVSTESAEAQAYFDQGLTLLYAFNNDAAYWSFFKASQADPHLAMAYWGMSFVLGKNINSKNDAQQEIKAYQHYQEALQHESGASKIERAYIATLSKRYSPQPDFNKQAVAYSQAMRGLHENYPDDPDAAVLFAESLMNIEPPWNKRGNDLNDLPESVTVLEAVLKRFPRHLGANHFYVHAVEASPHPEWGLASAERLKDLMPASGHIVHVPSHIYYMLGDYHQSALANVAGLAADREYIQQFGDRGTYALHYYSHNLFFLTRSYIMEGNFGRAKQAAEELENFISSRVHQMREMEEYASASLLVLLRFNRWHDILKSAEPEPKKWLPHTLWLYARTIAYLGLGDRIKALEEKKRLKDAVQHLPKDYQSESYPPDKLLLLADSIVKAKILENQGDRKKAAEELSQAVQLQDILGYHDFPDWFFPTREYLGSLLLRNAQYSQAEKIFREDLKLHLNNGRSLFGLGQSLKFLSHPNDLYWVQQQFQTAWLYSDTPVDTIIQIE